MAETRKLRIGVMGAGAASARTSAAAEEVGRLIAERGCILICGGRGGVMEAASRGAHEAGGLVVGILPGADDSEANPWVDVPIPTDLGIARNAVNVHASHVIIAVEGSFGALSEIAIALKEGKPVVSLNSWRLDEIGCDTPLFRRAATPAEAVSAAIEMARAR